MKLIISIENLREFRPISEDMPVGRVTPFIQEAHQVELKRLLGDALYVDFLLRYDNPADGKYAVYQELLVGKSYTYGGYSKEHPGLIGFMCYSSLARLYSNNQVNVTKFGLTMKKEEKSEQIKPEALTTAISELKSMALALQYDIQLFLQQNPINYPLYSYNAGSSLDNIGVGFFDPDAPSKLNQQRTNYNA